MEESADQADPREADCKAREDEGKCAEATGLLDGDEANADDKLTDLKVELD